MRHLRFVSLWIILTLLLLVALVLGLHTVPALVWANDDVDAIHTLVAAMENAVISQDYTAYLSYVDLSDPIFALEHTRWAEEWAATHPVDRFALDVGTVTLDGDEAHADMTMRWALRPDTSYRQATYPVVFQRGGDGAWRYAGETWIVFEAGDTFRVLAAPGRENAAEAVIAMLPAIYAHATASVDHTLRDVTEVKLYDNPDALGANTLLSLPEIAGWNEPGESLKLVARSGEGSAAYLQRVLAHELTHKLTFDLAGTGHGSYPWWVEEGIAEYVASAYWNDERAPATVKAIAELDVQGRLPAWDDISDFETTPYQLWQFVYPQGYTFVAYVTNTYGEAARNEWLALMAVEMALPEATEAAFGLTFEQLDTGFGDWLAMQLNPAAAD